VAPLPRRGPRGERRGSDGEVRCRFNGTPRSRQFERGVQEVQVIDPHHYGLRRVRIFPRYVARCMARWKLRSYVECAAWQDHRQPRNKGAGARTSRQLSYPNDPSP
jgi:hypothetical protein